MSQQRSKTASRADTVRMAVLVTLVVQNSTQALFMRAAFKKDDEGASSGENGGEVKPQAASTTAVLMAEVFKLLASLCLQLRDDGSLQQLGKTIKEDIFQKPKGMLKMAVPAGLYVLQNNLNYIASSNLDAPTVQLLYQLKILTTALFSVVMLKRLLIARQWIALAMLALGVGLVQMSNSDDGEKDPADGQNPLLGFVAIMMSCCTSGFAGVYFEMVLKGTAVSLWIRNVQLSTIGILIGATFVWWKDGEKVSEYGFYYGYNLDVWMSVLLNSLGGLVVAMVVKYADNVVKGFATSISILLTSVVSLFLFGFKLTIMFVVGSYFVIHATFLYSTKPKPADGAVAAPSGGGTSSSAGGTAPAISGTNMSGGGSADVEMPEKESLLRADVFDPESPRMGPRKASGVSTDT